MQFSFLFCKIRCDLLIKTDEIVFVILGESPVRQFPLYSRYGYVVLFYGILYYHLVNGEHNFQFAIMNLYFRLCNIIFALFELNKFVATSNSNIEFNYYTVYGI